MYSMMKNILLIGILTFIGTINCIGQNSTSELKKYFRDNILTLDPLEGLYDVEVTQQGENAFQRFPAEKTQFNLFIKKNSRGDLIVGNCNSGEIFDWTVERIGDTNVYNFKQSWQAAGTTNERVYLTNRVQFTRDFDIPQAQLQKDLGRNYQAGFRINYKWNFIKTYPTTRMYVNAETTQKENQPEKVSGTGFFLSTDGYIVTNYHVIENARTIKVSGINDNYQTSYTAKMEKCDKQNDLAILKITDASFKPLANIPYTFKYTTSSVGEDCFVLGYPLISTMGMDIKLTNGIISSKTGYEGNIAEYQMSAPIQPGNSGGPLFDKNGNIIGVVCAKHRDAENAGYAIKASYIRNLVELLPTNITMPQTNILTGKTLPKQVELASKAVCVIIVNGD